MLEILVVDALVCAILGGLIASAKGRSAAEGAFVGGILGLIGLLMVVLAPSKIQPTAGSMPAATGSLRPCPQCAELIQPAAVKCRFCGADVEPAAAQPVGPTTLAPAPSGSGLKFVRILIFALVILVGVLAVGFLQQQMDHVNNCVGVLHNC